MRIFIAVTLDAATRAQVAALTDALRSQPAVAAARVRWVPAANLHLTLRFLGELNEHRAVTVAEALTSRWALSPFQASLGAASLFPPRGAPRVVWLDVREGADGLHALHREVERRLAGIGFPPERRPFRPHLTIGRVKRIARRAERAFAGTVGATTVPPMQWTVDRVALMESRLSSEGAAYHEVAAVTLGPTACSPSIPPGRSRHASSGSP